MKKLMVLVFAGLFSMTGCYNRLCPTYSKSFQENQQQEVVKAVENTEVNSLEGI